MQIAYEGQSKAIPFEPDRVIKATMQVTQVQDQYFYTESFEKAMKQMKCVELESPSYIHMIAIYLLLALCFIFIHIFICTTCIPLYSLI